MKLVFVLYKPPLSVSSVLRSTRNRWQQCRVPVFQSVFQFTSLSKVVNIGSWTSLRSGSVCQLWCSREWELSTFQLKLSVNAVTI
jgi:hypothetical protein